MVVGASGEDSSAYGVNGNQNDNMASESGAAYVFSRMGTIWTQQSYLKGSSTDFVDSFGLSVSISGETIIVGSRYDSSQSGAADLFVRSGTNWRHQALLKASNAEDNHSYGWNDEFGRSVAIFGDTVIVGAHLEDSSATGVNGNQDDNSANASGAAYIFTGVGPLTSPALSIEEVAGQIWIFWPLTPTGYVLDETPILTGPTQFWNQVALPYQTNTTGIFITFPRPSDNQFYRLRKP